MLFLENTPLWGNNNSPRHHTTPRWLFSPAAHGTPLCFIPCLTVLSSYSMSKLSGELLPITERQQCPVYQWCHWKGSGQSLQGCERKGKSICKLPACTWFGHGKVQLTLHLILFFCSQCYYIGATSDAATKITNEVSKPLSYHMPVEKVCEKLKKKDSQICELKYGKCWFPDRGNICLNICFLSRAFSTQYCLQGDLVFKQKERFL